jgi:hypothetical protein
MYCPGPLDERTMPLTRCSHSATYDRTTDSRRRTVPYPPGTDRGPPSRGVRHIPKAPSGPHLFSLRGAPSRPGCRLPSLAPKRGQRPAVAGLGTRGYPSVQPPFSGVGFGRTKETGMTKQEIYFTALANYITEMLRAGAFNEAAHQDAERLRQLAASDIEDALAGTSLALSQKQQRPNPS